MTMRFRCQRAFTLIEMVVVLAVSAVLVAAVAMFLRWPFQSYLAVERRAEMTDIADTALRRIGRDLHVALPNSVRVLAGATTCMEMLPTKTGGRYRSAVDSAGNGDILDFTTADASFDMFGLLPTLPGQAPAAGDLVVVYNLGAAAAGADAYSGNNTNIIAGTGAGSLANESKITLGGAVKQFPFASPGSRFQVISTPVSYVCTPGAVNASGNGTGTLTRVSGYAINAAQSCTPGGTSALLASNVTACNFSYSPGTTMSNGLVSTQLEITQSNETVSLYDEVHISNAP